MPSARETRSDPVNVDTDRASMGWTNWDIDKKASIKVKKEQVVFQSLRSAPRGVIELDTPSPVHKRSKSEFLSSAPSSPNENPTNAKLGLLHADDNETLEQALENVMDYEYNGWRLTKSDDSAVLASLVSVLMIH